MLGKLQRAYFLPVAQFTVTGLAVGGIALLPLEAQALTYTFQNAAFSVASPGGGTGTITGSFAYNGSAITNFANIQISRWLFNSAATPVSAGYTGTTSTAGILSFTGITGSSGQSPPESLSIQNIKLANSPESISLTALNSGIDGQIRFCDNNGCPSSQTTLSNITFTSGSLVAVPLPLSAGALAPLALTMVRLRRRYKRTSAAPKHPSPAVIAG
ncbi:hypothetical protein [Synechococcus sp. RedBA-s]|uniref:hypothetical protein n=1 Tax=Synechococcus sp. RedBA-s TaxID=2823741 RepID=UPI0020CC6CEB|nr:hypothetical protein [Synechococcus sp. RedBA-s]